MTWDYAKGFVDGLLEGEHEHGPCATAGPPAEAARLRRALTTRGLSEDEVAAVLSEGGLPPGERSRGEGADRPAGHPGAAAAPAGRLRLARRRPVTAAAAVVAPAAIPAGSHTSHSRRFRRKSCTGQPRSAATVAQVAVGVDRHRVAHPSSSGRSFTESE